MADPQPQGTGVGGTLKSKLGPLPTWAWLAIVTVLLLGWYLLQKRKHGAAGSQAIGGVPGVVVQNLDGGTGPRGKRGKRGKPGDDDDDDGKHKKHKHHKHDDDDKKHHHHKHGEGEDISSSGPPSGPPQEPQPNGSGPDTSMPPQQHPSTGVTPGGNILAGAASAGAESNG